MESKGRKKEVNRKKSEKEEKEREFGKHFWELKNYSQFIYLTKAQKYDIMNELSLLQAEQQKKRRYLEN